MAPQISEDDLEVARDVLRYFTRNVQAADTLEGVARWRLLDERIYSNLERVTRAMALLVSEGLLVKEPVGSSGAIFRLNKEAMRKIERFLKKGKPRRRRKLPKKSKRKMAKRREQKVRR